MGSLLTGPFREPEHPCDYPDGNVGVNLHLGQQWTCPECGWLWELVTDDGPIGPHWRWQKPPATPMKRDTCPEGEK